MWEIVSRIAPRPGKSCAVRKNLQNFSEAAAYAEEAEGNRVQLALHCVLPSMDPLSSKCLCPLHSSSQCPALQRGIATSSRKQRCFELLVNEADPVAGPRTTKVSETPLNLKNAQLLKCCQPAACLKHLSALNARELFCRDLMPPLQQQQA